MIRKRLANAELEAIYDAIAEAVDRAPPDKRLLLLAKLSLALANLAGSREAVEAAIEAAARDL